MNLLNAIEASAYAEWVRSSPSIFAYTSILSLHAIGLAIIVGINMLIALRLFGYGADIPIPALNKLFPWMYLGFTVNALSGLSLLAANMSNDIGNWMFLLKLFLILLAMINLELLRSRVITPAVATGTAPTSAVAKLFGTSSLILWGLAIVAGRLTEYPNFVHTWFGF